MGPGDVVADRFEVEALAGAGAMGAVYRARDKTTGATVALKLLTGLGEDHSARFAREAQILSELTHPGIVRFVAYGTTEEGPPYLALEWLEGEDLSRRLNREPLGIEASVALARRLAEALGAAHRGGVVHRDIKPSNIFLARGLLEQPKLLDFGIALPTAADSSLTQPGDLLGTPGYMAPEQIRGRRDVDARADVFALGCVLFRCLAGKAPFAGEDMVETLMKAATETPPRTQSLCDEVSDELDDLVAEMLDKSPAARHRDGGAVAERIAALGSLRRASGQPHRRRQPRDSDTLYETAKSNLKAQATSFYGRKGDIAALEALFDSGHRLVTLLGPAGTGKTRLAQRFGELRQTEFSRSGGGGVWFCDLTDVRDLLGVCGSVARALDVALPPPSDSAADVVRLGRAIASRGRVLLLVDNCEQVVEDVARALVKWREMAPGGRFLATSREVLKIPGEQLYELLPLSLPQSGVDVQASEAVQLFVDRAQMVKAGYALTEGEAPMVAEIVRELDGLPLAIELAAARMGMLDAQTILDRLPRRFALLSSGPRDATARQRTLRGAIEWSWQLLQPWEQVALAQCSVFRGGFTLEAAEEVLSLPSSAPATLDVLQALHDKSLLRSYSVNDSEPTGPAHGATPPRTNRFGLYESIREFSREKLEESGDLDATLERHAAYYLALGARGVEADRGEPRAVQKLTLEFDNLLAVHRRALGGASVAHHRAALRAMDALDAVLWARGPGDLLLSLLEATLAREAPPSCALLVGRIRVRRAAVRVMQRQLPDARADAESALSIARGSGDALLEGRALNILGTVEWAAGRPTDALARFEQAAEAARRSGSREYEARVLNNLGGSLMDLRRLDDARDRFVEALGLYDHVLGLHQSSTVVHLNLSLLLQEQGHLEEAAAHLKSVELTPPTVRLRAMISWGWGTLRHEQGELREALTHYEAAIRDFRGVSDLAYEGFCLAAIGAVLAESDRVRQAEEAFDLASALPPITTASAGIDMLALHRGHHDLALARACEGAGDATSATRHRAAAARRLRALQDASRSSWEVRFAERLLTRAVGLSAGSPGLDSIEAAPPGAMLMVGRAGRWFRPPLGDRVDLPRRYSLRRLLLVLANHRLDAPGKALSVEALLREVYPGERFAVARSAAMRVHNGLSRLRALGLRDVILSESDGYLLDPKVPAQVES